MTVNYPVCVFSFFSATTHEKSRLTSQAACLRLLHVHDAGRATVPYTGLNAMKKIRPSWAFKPWF